MKSVFLLQNQDKLLLNKHGEWVDGREVASLFRTAHRDEALNQMVEVNTKDYTLRIKLLQCPVNERGQPQPRAEDLPPLMAGGASAANDDARVTAADSAATATTGQESRPGDSATA
ncbi:MAG: hypothetical protein GYB33_03840 [Gammaproteobacteria bacterium]|nr:hypothetical protein [Gammaproteobacteria bacterium]